MTPSRLSVDRAWIAQTRAACGPEYHPYLDGVLRRLRRNVLAANDRRAILKIRVACGLVINGGGPHV
jgi:hypothetical protein